MSTRYHSSKTRERSTSDSFSEFFHHATPKEKMRVFKEAARKANKDQRKLVKKIILRLKNT